MFPFPADTPPRLDSPDRAIALRLIGMGSRFHVAANEAEAEAIVQEATALLAGDEGYGDLRAELAATRADLARASKLIDDIERGDVRFAAACDRELTAITALPLDKGVDESISQAVGRVLAGRNALQDALDALMTERDRVTAERDMGNRQLAAFLSSLPRIVGAARHGYSLMARGHYTMEQANQHLSVNVIAPLEGLIGPYRHQLPAAAAEETVKALIGKDTVD